MGIKMDAVQALRASGKQVGAFDLQAVGCGPNCCLAAQTYGINWTTLLALFEQYGPGLEAILVSLFSQQPVPAPVAPTA